DELDGEPVANPLELTVPQDGSSHTLRAHAEGYEAAESTVRWDGPVQETLRLARATPPPTPMRPAPRAAASSAMRRTVQRSRPTRRRDRATRMRARMRATRMAAGFTTDNPY
ncbi:MAG TPA: hypothetical protein RMH80_19500, partial [Polyangiaceae bacterium LLY-WYZ-15_(1-7)]|nr:hypothetical protein [Polyangiaceae bacterium LLY-WYZ-15_(1-7)]